jgi:hypothetical protein
MSAVINAINPTRRVRVYLPHHRGSSLQLIMKQNLAAAKLVNGTNLFVLLSSKQLLVLFHSLKTHALQSIFLV